MRMQSTMNLQEDELARIGALIAGALGMLCARICGLNAGVEVALGSVLNKGINDLGTVLVLSHVLAAVADGLVAVEYALHTYLTLSWATERSLAYRRLAVELGSISLLYLALAAVFLNRPGPFWLSTLVYIGVLCGLELYLQRARRVARAVDE